MGHRGESVEINTFILPEERKANGRRIKLQLLEEHILIIYLKCQECEDNHYEWKSTVKMSKKTTIKKNTSSKQHKGEKNDETK